MPQQWSSDETRKLAEMRQRLQPLLSRRRQLPDVVGDRRLLRFLRGHKTVDKACEMYTKFLKWRDENDVDSIRDDVLYGGMMSQYDLPAARKIFSLLPQTMISADALDLCGNPVALESFSFQPETVLKEVPKPEYVLFMIYTLEYKSLMLDQLAHEGEQALLRRQQPMGQPYGVMVQSNIIRDLSGFGVAHVGGDGQTVMKWILEIAADNYPELLFKSHMVNTPWIFNSIWWLVKNILDPTTIKKISITGTDYMKVLLKDIPITSIPVAIGGKFVPREELFRFDTSPSGPFHYPRVDAEVNVTKRREHRLRVNGGGRRQQNENQDPNETRVMVVATASPRVLASGIPPSVRCSRGGASTPSNRSAGTFFYPVTGMISSASTETVLMSALGSRNVRVSHILKMGDPTRLRNTDLVEGFVEGRKRRARERDRERERERIPPSELQGVMHPQRSCKTSCVVQ